MVGALAFGVDSGWWKTHPWLVFASEEGGVGNKNPHPWLKFASKGGGVGAGWFMGAGCHSSKKEKKKEKKMFILKKHVPMGPIFSLQPIQTLFVIVKHK